ncbi:hypothetical protein KL908_004162 [Ogataea polymorpha]|nr:hypothetical protein KL908_004162 [Ogataea polymorpha]
MSSPVFPDLFEKQFHVGQEMLSFLSLYLQVTHLRHFYLSITSVDVVFELTYGWKGTIATLPNIALFTGVMIGVLTNIGFSKRYAKLLALNVNVPLPEERLRSLLYAAWMMPAGNLIFG